MSFRNRTTFTFRIFGLRVRVSSVSVPVAAARNHRRFLPQIQLLKRDAMPISISRVF